MDVQRNTLRVINTDFQLLGEIKDYTSLQLTHSHYGVPEFEMYLQNNSKSSDLTQRKNIIFIPGRPEVAFFIKYRNIKINEEGEISEFWSIRGEHLKSLLSQRIIIPPKEEAYDEVEGTAEQVIKHFVNTQAINPEDKKRVIPNLVIDQEYLETGKDEPTYSYQGRFQSLSDFLERICFETGYGWTIELDGENKKFVFKVTRGTDRSILQTDVPPILLSPEKQTLSELEYLESDFDFRNTALVAGQGEGVERKTVLLNNDNEGLDRYELFVDARDIDNEERDEDGVEQNDDGTDKRPESKPRPEEDIIADLTKRGEEKLTEREQEVFLEGVASNHNRYTFMKDWFLGDKVTIPIIKLDLVSHVIITEVKEVIEADKHEIKPVFDRRRPDLLSKLKRDSQDANILSNK